MSSLTEKKAIIADLEGFMFRPPQVLRKCKRVLIKPNAAYPKLHPVTTSIETLQIIIDGIRQTSQAEIIILEGTVSSQSAEEIFTKLGYQKLGVELLDVDQCDYMRMVNPLEEPYVLKEIYVPQIISTCDYKISVSPFKLQTNLSSLTIKNLLGLLPRSKYRAKNPIARGKLHIWGIHKCIADVFFTLDFDLGIIDGRRKFISQRGPAVGKSEDFGKILVGDLLTVDKEALRLSGLQAKYIRLIENEINKVRGAKQVFKME